MNLGTNTLGTAPLGTQGTAAGTSEAAARAGASFSATVDTATSLEFNGPVLGAPELRTYTPPPQSAERFLCYLLPKRQREDILGCLAEEFAAALKYGVRKARRVYWAQFFWSIVATLPPWIWWAVLGALAWLWSKLGN